MIGGAGSGWHVARWGAAGAVVLAAHFGGAWVAMNWGSHEQAPGDPPAAVMIELAPLPVSANSTPEAAAAPGPQVAEAPEAEAPVESKVAENEPPPPPEPEPEPLPEEIKAPEVPQKAEVTLPAASKIDPQKEREKQRKLERERQKRIEMVRERRKEREHKRELERAARAKARQAEKNATAQRTSAPSGAPGPRAPSAASASAGANSAAMASWRGAVMSHLNRHKRFPSGAGSGGTVTVSFSINRNGGVTAARLARSSGDGVIDSEAVATVRRASPVPAPPDHIAGSAISLSVPIRYSR